VPRNLSAFALRWDAIQVTWTVFGEKEEVASYEVQYCSLSECRALAVFSTSVVIESLPQYTTFKVKVRGRNTVFAGPWKLASDVKTLGMLSFFFVLWQSMFVALSHSKFTKKVDFLFSLV